MLPILALLSLCVTAAVISAKETVDGTIVGAQYRCQGYLCPKWALDISRFDIVRNVNVQFEYNLLEILPLAPTSQRSAPVHTAYNPKTREFTVAVQDYPGVGIDTFFVATINGNVTSATAKLSNVIIGHPDGQAGNVGKMTLEKILVDDDGKLMVIFQDGAIHQLDLSSKTYKELGNLKSTGVRGELTKAHILVGTSLKSFFYDSEREGQQYLIKTDLDLSSGKAVVSSPVTIQPLGRGFVFELPIAAHMISNPNTNVSSLAVVSSGNFDTIVWIDEETGASTAINENLAEENTGGYPISFDCFEGSKDCDTKWETTAYDPVRNQLYMQIHATIDDFPQTYIYELQFLQNRVTTMFYPYVDPNVMMNFGYSGYQWVSFQ